MLDALRAGLTSFVLFIPKLLGFLVILFIGWLIAKGLSKLVGLLLSKIGFGNLLRRAGLANITERVNFDVGGLIVKLVYYFVLLIALQFAFSAFGPNPVESLLTEIITFLPRIIVAIILVIVAATIARIVKDLILSVLSGRQFAPLLGNIAYGVILALGIIAAVNQIGVATTVTQPLLITVLATAGGIAVVGVGGGLIKPMQSRWERGLESLDQQLQAPPDHAAVSSPTAAPGQSQGPAPTHSTGTQSTAPPPAEPGPPPPAAPPGSPGQNNPGPPPTGQNY